MERGREYQAQLPTTERVAWTWCLFFAFLIPEFGTFIRSFRICLFKSCRRSSFSDFFVVLVFESMHIVGLSLLIFVVLPELDVVKGAMITNCLCFIPAVLQLASRHSKESRRFLKVLLQRTWLLRSYLLFLFKAPSQKTLLFEYILILLIFKVLMDLVAIGGQCTGFFVWPLVEVDDIFNFSLQYYKAFLQGEEGSYVAWTIPIATFLTSAGWWENYVDRRLASF